MEVRQIVIHSFRGVLSADIVVGGYSLLVGPNDAGKSTVIDAIDRILARRFGFSDVETDVLINYDIKYRMGLANGNTA